MSSRLVRRIRLLFSCSPGSSLGFLRLGSVFIEDLSSCDFSDVMPCEPKALRSKRSSPPKKSNPSGISMPSGNFSSRAVAGLSILAFSCSYAFGSYCSSPSTVVRSASSKSPAPNGFERRAFSFSSRRRARSAAVASAVGGIPYDAGLGASRIKPPLQRVRSIWSSGSCIGLGRLAPMGAVRRAF